MKNNRARASIKVQNAIFNIKKNSKDLSFLFKIKHIIIIIDPKKDSELETFLSI